MPQHELVTWPRARWIAPFFAAAAFVLVPWVVVLAVHLPSMHAASHWDVTWVGFDAALTGLLVAVAVAAWRGSPWLEGVATAAAALMVVDAWFDITTSSSGSSSASRSPRLCWSSSRSRCSASYSPAAPSAHSPAGCAQSGARAFGIPVHATRVGGLTPQGG